MTPFWVLVTAGTAYVMGSAGEPVHFDTLRQCQAAAAQALAYDAGSRHVGIIVLERNYPMQCFHVDAETHVMRSYSFPTQGWQSAK